MRVFKHDDTPEPGDLIVWHIPQVPGKPFKIQVASIEEGRELQSVLASYDLFQYRNRIKPDYANVNGLSTWEDDGEGNYDWYDVEEDDG